MKRFLLVFLLGLAAVVSSAQVAVTGGLNFSKIKDVDSGSYTGYQVGFAYKQPLILGLAIQPELVFASKKGASDALNMNYIELPVQVQMGLDLIALRPYIFAEPFVGYALGGNLKVQDVKRKINMENLESRLEYGLGIGAGLDVLNKVQVSCKYYWNFDDCSLNSFLDYAKEHISNRESFNGFMVSAAIFF